MLKKLIRRVKSFIYGIPFGMKAGDELLAVSNPDNSEGATIQQKVDSQNVLHSLLQGEVTQEVEELRYEMYKADEEANNYKYIGNGQAIKIEANEKKKASKRLKFIQENLVLDYGASESLKKLESEKPEEQLDYKDRRLIKCEYEDDCVQYRLENYLDKIEVNLKNGTKTKLFFLNDKTYNKTVPIINQLKRIKGEIKSIDSDDIILTRSYLSKCTLFSLLKTLEFSTFNATNNVPNGIQYKFSNPSYYKIGNSGDYMYLELEWEKYEGGQLLSELYYSESADNKFKLKERRGRKTGNTIVLGSF